jgi:hypothetical protein
MIYKQKIKSAYLMHKKEILSFWLLLEFKISQDPKFLMQFNNVIKLE